VGQIRLPTGREAVIRPIEPGDGPALQAAYDRLSPLSKYRRFLAPKPHLTSADTRYLVQVDGQDHVALVATRVDDPGWILGVGRFVRLPEDPKTAEFAVVVGDPFQREGIATALLRELSEAASALGITRFRATVLAENVPANRLVQGLPGRVAAERHAGPVHEIEVELAA
jgi:RimJ/RimL family protein N-acetyltransferase